MSPLSQAQEPNYTISVSDEAETGLKLYSVYDPVTGITVSIPETPKLDLPSFLASTGARFSRFVGTVRELYTDINSRKMSPADFMRRILGYGHASVAEMADIRLDLQCITQLMALRIFNIMPTGAGQEKSTRYVGWEEQEPLPLAMLLPGASQDELRKLEALYQGIFGKSREIYTKWQNLIHPLIEGYIYNNRNQVPEGITETQIKSSIAARTLDIARRWILMGNRTSMMYQANIRLWSDLISYLRATPDITFQALANQIEFTLQVKKVMPEFSGDYASLMQYKETDGTVFENLKSLRVFLVSIEGFSELTRESSEVLKEPTVERLDITTGEALFFEYIKAIQPNLRNAELINFIRNLSDNDRRKISNIIYKGHHKHNRMREIGDVRGILLAFYAPLADVRDFNRHRATGRMQGIWHTTDLDAILQSGFDRNVQLFGSDYLQDLQSQWESDAREFYGQLRNFFDAVRPHLNEENRYLIHHLLPLGHLSRMYYSVPPTQLSYILNLRGVQAHDYPKGRSDGGDASYIRLAELAYETLVNDPYFAGLLGGKSDKRVNFDPNNIAHLLGRS
jgi:thymidylate synthase ThyX